MSVTPVGAVKYTPTSSIPSRTITLPSTIQVGDAIFVEVVTASGAAANKPTLSGVAGLTEIGDLVFSGHRHTLWVKDDAAADDASKVLTVATAASLRVTIQVAVFRGDGSAPVIDKIVGVNGSATAATNITSPGSTTATTDVEIQFVAGAGNIGVTTFTTPPGLTKLIDSYDAGTAGGNSYAVIGHNQNLTNLPAGTAIGGDLWSVNTGCLLSAFTVGLKVATAALSVRPTSTITSTGWTPIGGATTIHEAVADESDTTGAESGDNPNGTQTLVSGYAELAGGAVLVRERVVATQALPLIATTVDLLQGSTVIASRTVNVGNTPVNIEFTTSPSETANITDRTQLRRRIVGVTQ